MPTFFLALAGLFDALAPAPKAERFLLGAQATFIEQALPNFRSPYAGKNSLRSIPQGRLSDTYTLYLGARLARGVEAYFDPEMARGAGIGDALGLAAYTNGDVIRNPTLGQSPYVGRLFARWTIPTGTGEERVERGENQIAGTRPTHRVLVTAGKLGTNDLFDTNAYANSTRTQFMNWALLNDPAYDYAADTRGYSQGAAVEWIQPAYALRVGSFAMPKVANGLELDPRVSDSRGDQAELELHPELAPRRDRATVRLLVFRNLATMGDYDEALRIAAPGETPDVTATRARGRSKAGAGLNLEQPLGDTGLFARVGTSDGRTESFAYTECDNHVSVGAQLSGRRWHTPSDRLGVALLSDGLYGPHRRYLEAGGLGFILGDGRLAYGRESALETYYQRALNRTASLAFDFQLVANPGYNAERGPVPVIGARLHFEL